MFISNNERIQLRKDIETLSKLVSDMNTELICLNAKVKVLEGFRNKKREASKRYYAKKKLEKQNGNSVSTPSV